MKPGLLSLLVFRRGYVNTEKVLTFHKQQSIRLTVFSDLIVFSVYVTDYNAFEIHKKVNSNNLMSGPFLEAPGNYRAR